LISFSHEGRSTRWLALALAMALALIAGRAAAASADANARAEVGRVLSKEYARSNFAGARTKLLRALQRCGPACSGATRAQIGVALGLVALRLGNPEEASKRFAAALRDDPDASLPGAAKGIDDEAQAAFEAARRPTADPTASPASGPGAESSANAAQPPDPTPSTDSRPRVSFVRPQGVNDLAVTLDGSDLAAESLSQRVPVDPGKHTVHAEGTIHGVPLVFDKVFHAEEGETVGIVILLAPLKAEYLSPSQIKCMLAAKSQEELLACLPQTQRGIDIKAGLETSGYTDTNHVNVATPAVNASISSPTAGWNVSGSYLVDVVSAASPDVVSEASPPFHEVRHAGALGGGFKVGAIGVQLDGDLSSEPDYLSAGAGVALTADLNDKLVTPSVGYSYSHDTIGRSTTPFKVFHHNLDVSEFEVGSTFVMSPTSILLLSTTLDLERGDQSKPYRYVPMFSAAVAPTVSPGASIGFVNDARLPVRPLEQLPLSRNRYAIGARFVHAFGSATLRVEQRLYTDSWQQTASTTDLRTLFDLSGWLRVWLHGRFNAQGAANFYKLAYTSGLDAATGRLAIPALRSDDRELSPLVTVTGGPGLLVKIGSGEKVQYGISAQMDVMYTRYFDALFITGRTATYGTVGLDGEFE
jgi:hypothetical protein